MKYLIATLTFIFLVSCNQETKNIDNLNLKSKLAGKWKAKAFDGELHEKWNLSDNGWMEQEGHYIEKNDTSYSAKSRIEKINSEIILLSVIKNSNPKIFKAINVKENEIVFENDDYKNPYNVKYEFLSNNSYRRTIKGYEKDSLVIYEFDFKKIE